MKTLFEFIYSFIQIGYCLIQLVFWLAFAALMLFILFIIVLLTGAVIASL